MCIIAHKPAGVVLSEQVYRNCFDANRDGAGFVYAENGKLEMQKGFFTFESFWLALQPHAKRELIVHFRWATHGLTDVANCHPWMVNDCYHGFSFAVAHNGILSYDSSELKSDTGHFVDEILGPQLKRDPWFFDHDSGVYLTEQTIGSSNKFAVMRNDGKVYLLNRSGGVIDTTTNTWFSNDGYMGARRWLGFQSGGWGYGDGPVDEWDDVPARFGSGRTVGEVLTEARPTLLLPQRSVLNGKPVDTPLPHLNHRARKKLYRQAAAQFGGSGMGPTEMVRALREMFRDEHPEFKDLGDEPTDRLMIKLGYDGWDRQPIAEALAAAK